jgi:hypothetical protein
MSNLNFAKQTLALPDWYSQKFLADPYPRYARLRESDPVYFDEPRRTWLESLPVAF